VGKVSLQFDKEAVSFRPNLLESAPTGSFRATGWVDGAALGDDDPGRTRGDMVSGEAAAA